MAGFEFLGAESFDGHADVLFLAARIGKAEVNEFDVLIFDCLEDLFWGHIFFLETGFLFFIESVAAKSGPHSAIKRKSPRLQKLESKTSSSAARHVVVSKPLCFITQTFCSCPWGNSELLDLGNRGGTSFCLIAYSLC